MRKKLTAADKRGRLVGVAADLFYTHGFARVALADMAAAAEVPLGNVRYYFKSKAEIGEVEFHAELPGRVLLTAGSLGEGPCRPTR